MVEEQTGGLARLAQEATHRLSSIREEMLAGQAVGMLRLSCPSGLTEETRLIDDATGKDIEDVMSFEVHPMRQRRMRVILIRLADDDDHDRVSRWLVECWLVQLKGS